ncbi:activating signal cointegrator 1 complex subunit 2 homolog [Macrobrachium nipponense]|uniref:activating signal cointegrator 1 complex subunit 2 homolog n=1 Tax=Macrobrachium nipponense TaxID=159736 RepID=UPI0030C81A32
MKGQNPQTTTRTLQQQHTTPTTTSYPQHLPQQNPPTQQQHPQQTSHPQQPTEYNPPPLQQQQPQQHRHQEPSIGSRNPHQSETQSTYTTTTTRPTTGNTYHRDPRQTQNQDTSSTPTPASNPMSFYSTSTRKTKTPTSHPTQSHEHTPTPNSTRDGSTSAESQHNTVEQSPENPPTASVKTTLGGNRENCEVEDVSTGFEELSEDEDIPSEFPLYFEVNYIGVIRGRGGNRRRASPSFPISHWNMNLRTQRSMPRTNNSLEGFHSALSNNAQQPHHNLWKLMDRLMKEEVLSQTKVLHWKEEMRDLLPISIRT